jgi:hypothetical protein
MIVGVADTHTALWYLHRCSSYRATLAPVGWRMASTAMRL